jgi:hypothetical protein
LFQSEFVFWNSHILQRKIESLLSKSRLFAALPTLFFHGNQDQRSKRLSHRDGGGAQISLFFSHWRGGDIYRYVSIRMKKSQISNCNAQCILQLSRILQSTCKCDLFTVVSNYFKYCEFLFFYADNDLYIDIHEYD